MGPGPHGPHGVHGSLGNRVFNGVGHNAIGKGVPGPLPDLRGSQGGSMVPGSHGSPLSPRAPGTVLPRGVPMGSLGPQVPKSSADARTSSADEFPHALELQRVFQPQEAPIEPRSVPLV